MLGAREADPRLTGALETAEYNRAVPARAFQPKFMKVGVLTAALQELTPREARNADPDRAIEDWLQYCS